MVTALVSLFGAGPLLEREAGDEHEEEGEEYGAEDGGVEGGVSATGDVVVGRGGDGDHEDCWERERMEGWVIVGINCGWRTYRIA